jgi:hypothetical protein
MASKRLKRMLKRQGKSLKEYKKEKEQKDKEKRDAKRNKKQDITPQRKLKTLEIRGHFNIKYKVQNTGEVKTRKISFASVSKAWDYLINVVGRTIWYDNDAFSTEMIRLLAEDDTTTYDSVMLFGASDALESVVVETYNDSANVEVSEKLGKRKLRDTAQKYLSSKHLTFHLNYNFDDLSNIVDEERFYSSEYVKSNFKQDACFVLLILDTYKTSFDKYHSKLKGKTKDLKLDFEYLRNVCGSDGELSFDDARHFFETHRLGLQVFNGDGQVMYEILQEKYNNNIKPSILKCIYHNNHVYKIDEIKSFEHRTTDEIKLSNTFPIVTREDVKDDKCFMVANNQDELYSCLQCLKCGPKRIDILYNGNLNKVLRSLLDNGYNPEIKTKRRIDVCQLSLCNIKRGDFTLSVNIIKPYDNMVDGDNFTTQNEYDSVQSKKRELYDMMLNKHNLSYYNDGVKAYFNKYGICPNTSKTKYWKEADEYWMADVNKCYTKGALMVKFIPVITQFDSFMEYDGHDIVDNFLYVIHVEEWHPLFNKEYVFTYGCNLKMLKIKHRIERYIKTIPLYDNARKMTEKLDSLYKDSTITEKVKKMTANVLIGKFGKKYNTKYVSKTFLNKDDAIEYKLKNGGHFFEVDEGVFIHTREYRTELVNGFRPLRELILDNVRMLLYKYVSMLKSDGVDVVSIKTDALYFCKPQKEHLMIEKFVRDEIGFLKLVKNVKPYLSPSHFIENQLLGVYEPHINRINISDEYNLVPILNRIISHDKPLLVMGKAGSGKTFSALKYCVENKKEKLVVCPYNSQCKKIISQYKCPSVTFHKLKGLTLDERQRVEMDVSEYDVILFDEVLLYPIRHLVKIQDFMERNNDKIFLATCDPRQLEAIDDIINDNVQKIGYIEKMFGSVIDLKVYKRVAHDDAKMLEDIDKDLETMTIRQVMTKYFKTQMVSDVSGFNKAISYYNETADRVNRTIHERHEPKGMIPFEEVDGIKYFEGQEIVCKRTMSVTGGKIFAQNIYRIEKFSKGHVHISDILDDTQYAVLMKHLGEYLKLPYCITCHSSQGASFDEPYVICDWDSKHVTKNWFYTAITRTRNLKNVFFLNKYA